MSSRGGRLRSNASARLIEIGPLVEDEARERPEAPADTVKLGLCVGKLELEALMHVLVEMFEELLASIVHPGADLFIHLCLQLAECGFDLLRGPAFLVDGENALFEIDPRFDGAEHFVGRTEDAAEKAELLGQQFQHAAVSFVALVEEVDDDHVVFLAITMAAADSLLDSLRVPGKS